MNEELIIQQLKDKEAHLLNELNKVRLALRAFIDENMSFGNGVFQNSYFDELVPKEYNKNLPYNSKILFILNNELKPLLVDDIVLKLHAYEPELNLDKVHKSVSYNLCMLAKYAKVKKHPFNRKIKYSL